MPLQSVHIIGLCIFSLLLGVGQLLFKAAADRTPPITRVTDIVQVLGVPLLWLALILYGLTTLLWVCLLQQVPLSRAYPFAALAFVLVPVGAAAFFGERLSLATALGSALIVAGICVINLARG